MVQEARPTKDPDGGVIKAGRDTVSYSLAQLMVVGGGGGSGRGELNDVQNVPSWMMDWKLEVI